MWSPKASKAGLKRPIRLQFARVTKKGANSSGKRTLAASACRNDPDRVYRAGAGSHQFVGLKDEGFQRHWIEAWLTRPQFQIRFNAEHDAFLMPLNLPLMPATQSPTVVVG